jgi:Zn-dependent protease/CBS domain-containing protein
VSSRALTGAWTFQVGRILGIPIRLHVTFVLLLLWVGFAGAEQGQGVWRGFAFLLLLVLSVALHELGHALMARRYGIATEEIVLLPIGGLARLRGEPAPGAELAIALAGPAVNLLLALLLTTALLLRGGTLADPGMPPLLRDLLVANLALFGFNLVPALPLDGGRALRAALLLIAPQPVAARLAARIGQAFAVLVALLALLLPGGAGLPLIVLAALLFFGAGREAGGRRVGEFAGRTALDAMASRFERLAPQESLEQAALLLLRTPQQDFPVIDAWGRAVGALSRPALLGALGRLGGEAPVLEVMDRGVVVVRPETPLAEVVTALRAGSPSPAVVADEEGVAGIVTLEGVARMAAIVAALARQPVARG